MVQLGEFYTFPAITGIDHRQNPHIREQHVSQIMGVTRWLPFCNHEKSPPFEAGRVSSISE
jgi:hypothetical protein